MSKFIPKTHLVRSPTLLIGIGGIGGEIVRGVNALMSDHDKSVVKMMVMDTDANALSLASDENISYVQTSKNALVRDYLLSHPEYLEWFPTDPFINIKSLIQGAGQIRSVSRLGALASKDDGAFMAINRAVDDILRNQGDAVQRSVRVMIVGSATGGTGSGLGIQLPFYLKRVLSDAGVPNVLVRGLFIMPSLTDDPKYQDTESKQKAVNVNGYAFLKELNAFYRCQTTPAEQNMLRVEEYVPGMQKDPVTGNPLVSGAGMIPYDFLFLLEKMNAGGTHGYLDVYVARAAQLVLNQLFSPVSNKGFSTEDNLITATVPTGGMNRYCGAGVSHAIYPKDELVRYCSLRYTEQMLGGYWLEIDRRVRQKDEQQRRLRKTNPSLSALNKGETYCQVFKELCDPTKHTAVSELTALKAEMSVTEHNKKNEKITKDLDLWLIDKISKRINEAFTASGVAQEAEKCRMRASLKSTKVGIASSVSDSMEKLRNFSLNSVAAVNAIVGSTAEEIMPSDLKLAQNTPKTSQHCIYAALSDKHPIAARYLLYKLLAALQAKKSTADTNLNTAAGRPSIFDMDFYKEGTENEATESPSEALAKTKAGWLSGMKIYSAEYSRLVTSISEEVSGEAQRLLEIAKGTFESVVYYTVIERLQNLIRLYEEFFDEAENILRDKTKEIAILETGMGEGVNGVMGGDMYICSNATCKKALYDEFTNNVSDSDMEMSKEVKRNFFDKMFGRYTYEYAKQNNPTLHIPRFSYRDLFEEGLLAPVVAQFSRNGFKHLDMSILDAIYKQYFIESEAPDDKGSDDFKAYFQKVCSSLTELAAPYLQYERNVPNYESGGMLHYFWGLNNSGSADFTSGNPSGSVNMKALTDLFGSAYTAPLLDDSFQPYSLVCYATIYDLQIENCLSYKVGSDCEKYYRERLANYVDRENYVASTDPNARLAVIHPHLDRRWHQHAYLPELMGYDDAVQCHNTRLAFMMAVALKCCNYVTNEYEHITCWRYTDFSEGGHDKAVLVDEQELTSKSHYDLYKAFYHDRVMVNNMTALIEKKTAEAKASGSYSGIEEKDVMEHALIKALRCCMTETAEDGTTLNLSVLDLLHNVFRASGNRAATVELIKSLETFLQKYAITMMGENLNRGMHLYKELLKEIGASSHCYKDDVRASVSPNFLSDIKAFNPKAAE